MLKPFCGVFLIVLFFSCLFPKTGCADKHKFKKCKEKAWCERLRNNVEEHVSGWEVTTISSRENYVSGLARETWSKQEKRRRETLSFQVEAFPRGVVRVKMVEESLAKSKSKVRFRLDVDRDVVVQRPVAFDEIYERGGKTVARTKEGTEVALDPATFGLKYSVRGQEYISFNERGLLVVESFFYEPGENETEHAEGQRAAVSFDVLFGKARHVFGLPERTTPFSMPPTAKDEEPYRLFNLDIFEYVLGDKIGIYGNVPFVMTLDDRGQSVGLFFLNPTETFVDVEKDKRGVHSHFVAENGMINVFFVPGPSPKDVVRSFVRLTGLPHLPPLFSVGYHQCRWNYKDEEDCRQVNDNFNKHDLPYDTLWLDIEHTDAKKYFTWDKDFFPDPEALLRRLAQDGRKMVTISDPHIKAEKGYFVYDEAVNEGFLVKGPDGEHYQGECWPGKSSWLDFYNPRVREYYANLFRFDRYKGSAENLFTWIDMNEPSVFNGPEVTMAPENLHHGGVQHREIHNIYGLYHAMAAYKGLVNRGGGDVRPFILTRSFFAGTQRYAGVWTGDNDASWDHLKASIPMLFQLGIAGINFVGADVGGFFNNPSDELLQRWYQMGIFYPFFRAHAHLETKRREPWLFGDDVLQRIKRALKKRYVLLPYIYTLFYRSHKTGLPLFQPLFLEYPMEKKTYTMEDQFLLGPDLLAKPVTDEGCTKVETYLPKGVWYEYEAGNQVTKWGQTTVSLNVDMDTIPIFQRGGSVLPLKMRLRKSSEAMADDPYTLQIALDRDDTARGELFADDGKSFDYRKKGHFILRNFYFEENQIFSNSSANKFDSAEKIERIRILGWKSGKPQRVVFTEIDGEPLSDDYLVEDMEIQLVLMFEYDKRAKVLTIKRPNISIKKDFRIKITP